MNPLNVQFSSLAYKHMWLIFWPYIRMLLNVKTVVCIGQHYMYVPVHSWANPTCSFTWVLFILLKLMYEMLSLGTQLNGCKNTKFNGSYFKFIIWMLLEKIIFNNIKKYLIYGRSDYSSFQRNLNVLLH